jgi:outer membrane protein
MMVRSLILSGFLCAQSALAGGMAVVDLNKAGSLVREGAKIQAELQQLQSDRQQRLSEMEAALKAKYEDYQKQEMILSEETKAKKQAEIQQGQIELQQAAMAAEQEIQLAQQRKANSMFERMRTVVEAISKEKGYDIVLESTAVMYNGTADDITAELVTRFDSGK